MAITLERKQQIVEEVAEVAKRSVAVLAAEYRGLAVDEMTQLRQNARKQGVTIKVVRNTLARRALQESDFASLSEALVGPLVLAFSLEEPSAGAKLFKESIKASEHLKVVALSVGGKVLPGSQLEAVAALPSREQALAQLVMVLKAPVSKLSQVLASPAMQLVKSVTAAGQQKQST